MITAPIKGKSSHVAFIGLSFRDIELLRNGCPMRIDGASLGLPNDVLIKASVTDVHVMEDMRAIGWQDVTDAVTA